MISAHAILDGRLSYISFMCIFGTIPCNCWLPNKTFCTPHRYRRHSLGTERLDTRLDFYWVSLASGWLLTSTIEPTSWLCANIRSVWCGLSGHSKFKPACINCSTKNRRPAIIGLFVIWIVGQALSLINWTSPIGNPTKVALIQGNIAQEMKWNESIAIQTVNQYLGMTKQAQADLVILPETALPLAIDLAQKDMAQEQVLTPFKTIAMQDQKAILVGAVSQKEEAYFNTMLGISSIEAVQVYHKSHLVPFGEFIPLKSVFGWIYRDWLNMPLSDLSRGSQAQKPMQMAGQKSR